ncbi:MAG: hypothetical protein AAGD01_03970 [Acidobacteriota bacterium]
MTLIDALSTQIGETHLALMRGERFGMLGAGMRSHFDSAGELEEIRSKARRVPAAEAFFEVET